MSSVVESLNKFMSKIYGSDYFGIVLVGIIIFLIILFIIIFISGKKDEKKRKLETTQALEKANIDAMAEVNKEPSALEIPVQTENDNSNVIGAVETVNNVINSDNIAVSPATIENPGNIEANPTILSEETPIINENVVQQINDNFNNLAVSINEELNDIDSIKESKDQLLNNEQTNINQPVDNNLGVTFEKPDMIEEPINNFAVEEPAIPTNNSVTDIPTVPETPVNTNPNSYVAPASSYKETPYVPTTQFSSVNVASSTVNSKVDDNIEANSNMNMSVNSINNDLASVAEEQTVTTNLNQNDNLVTNDLPKTTTAPAGFEMPMLNPKLVKEEEPSIQKPANSPSFAFENEDSDSFEV